MVVFMKKILKLVLFVPVKILATVFFGYETLVHRIFPQLNGRLRRSFIEIMDNDMEEVKLTNKGKIYKLKLYTPNFICAFRSSTFHTK